MRPRLRPPCAGTGGIDLDARSVRAAATDTFGNGELFTLPVVLGSF
ncbi:hypothetical protein [Streptomyces sp. NRRL B-24484]|nr:hypothetical protein [Streptomyces sp. NRRL B-24484]